MVSHIVFLDAALSFPTFPPIIGRVIRLPLRSCDWFPLAFIKCFRNDLLVPRSRTSTSQQCAFASAGPLLWNCLSVKTRAQILSSSLSFSPRLLKSFLFLGLIALEGASE